MTGFYNYNYSQKNTIIIGRMIQKGDYRTCKYYYC